MTDLSSYHQQNLFKLWSIWLTSTGEDYMRELESQPGAAKRITVAVVKESWEEMKSFAAQVLAELIKP
jgi:hypothetical protein